MKKNSSYIQIVQETRIAPVKVASSSFLGKCFFLIKKIINLTKSTRNNSMVYKNIKKPIIIKISISSYVLN